MKAFCVFINICHQVRLSQAHGCVRLYSGRHTASSVTESSLESMRINVLAESEEGGAAEKPGGPLSQNARP